MGRFTMVNIARGNGSVEIRPQYVPLSTQLYAILISSRHTTLSELPFHQKWTALEACFKRDKELLHWVAVGGLQTVQLTVSLIQCVGARSI